MGQDKSGLVSCSTGRKTEKTMDAEDLEPRKKKIEKRNLEVIGWSVHSRDTRNANPQAVADRVLKQVRAGDIVLMHDGHDLPGKHRYACPEAVGLVLQGLQTKGLRSVTVSELLAR